MIPDFDEIDLAILDIIDMTDEAGLSRSQAARLLYERIEIAFLASDASAWDWPDPQSNAIH